ncbi:orotate phosphoribosyltransferase [Desulfovibrio inopinatus]|uniref:orotate phosphoribosyltransferase n=1 Tax=Desulfovibrio inopinatus TaxID=102109 RepID=UPI00041602A8|nr:orotate phosphoribosyltransferase [Desulfovibrio inopinatus]
MKAELARLLVEKSYIEGEVTLTSGRKSDYYFDCKQTALHPRGAYLIGNLFYEMLEPLDVVGVGGMTLGADPLVTAVSVVSATQKKPLPAFIVRKQSKGHGTNQYLEGMGNFSKGDKVALLEDVVTTGGTLVKVIERVRDAGLVVTEILTVLDREEGGRENLADAGFALRAIFTRAQLLEFARS